MAIYYRLVKNALLVTLNGMLNNMALVGEVNDPEALTKNDFVSGDV